MIIEGEKMLQEAQKEAVPILDVYATSPIGAELSDLPVIEISTREMKELSQLKSPSPVLAVIERPHFQGRIVGEKLLILDGIRDPGNLGTMIRTADWFGVNSILMSADCVDPFNSKVVQSTMGSIFRVNLVEEELVNRIEQLKSEGWEVSAAVMNGTPFSELEVRSKHAVVIGSESHGIRKEVIDVCSSRITIEGSGRAESLNAGVAAALFLQRLTND